HHRSHVRSTPTASHRWANSRRGSPRRRGSDDCAAPMSGSREPGARGAGRKPPRAGRPAARDAGPPSLIRGGSPRRPEARASDEARTGIGTGTQVMSWNEITVLVERAKTGDREAYGELVSRFQGSVYAMALSRVRDPLEAQELAQDVFVHAMRKLPQLRDARCFAGWLRRITARMAINRLTRRGPLFGADPELLEAVQGHE